jgi:hypothetical protein
MFATTTVTAWLSIGQTPVVKQEVHEIITKDPSLFISTHNFSFLFFIAKLPYLILYMPNLMKYLQYLRPVL